MPGNQQPESRLKESGPFVLHATGANYDGLGLKNRRIAESLPVKQSLHSSS
jgi:hypothetical protein